MGKHDKDDLTPEQAQAKADSFDAQFSQSAAAGFDHRFGTGQTSPLPETQDTTSPRTYTEHEDGTVTHADGRRD